MIHPVPLDCGEYSIYKAGKLVGSESFTVESHEDGLLAMGHVRLETPEPGSQDVELYLDLDYRPRRLILDGTSSAVRTKRTVTFRERTAQLIREGPKGRHSEELPIDPDVVVLASNVFHHFLLLLRRYDARGSVHQSFPLFPSGSVVVEEQEGCLVRLDGRQEALRHLFVDIEGIFGIHAFLLDTRLVKISAPLQGIEAILQDIPGLDSTTELLPLESRPTEIVASPIHIRAEEAQFPAPDGVTLAGTLTLPAALGPLPAVLLVAGSGPQDRDSNTGPGGLRLGIFRTLAECLSASGLAVLRYDKRGVGASGGTFESVSLHDLVEDARSAIRFLRARPDIDSARIAIVGHSEGGLIASLVAEEDPYVRAIMLLGTMAHRLDETLLGQFERLVGRLLPEDRLAAALARRRQTLEVLRQKGDWDAPEVEEQVRRAVPPAKRKWFQEHFAVDPRQVLRRVHAPVAIFQGGRDVQVDPDEAELLGAALDEVGRRDHLVRIFPGLDHLFMWSEGRGLSEYTNPSRKLDPDFLEALVEWIKAKLAETS